ncbi:MAG: repeat-associated core domain protein, partial [Anaerocolumna sp.]|nr:repeat-associated core domain protein [Anaerocolumna sp.]
NPNTPNDPYDMINPEIFEFTGYINDINQEYTEVLMTTDSEGNYRGAYTYVNGERISVEDLGQVEGVPNNPLYYLYDALGTTAAITNMNAGIIDNNRFAPFGEPLSPVAKNSRLTNSPWGYTGESPDIEAGLVYLRARYYEPDTGRFIQQDSYPYFGEIEEPLTRNLYIYGNGNPLKHTDPSGHIAIPLPLFIPVFILAATVYFVFTPAGKKVIKNATTAINKGVVITGKAITSAVKKAADDVKKSVKSKGADKSKGNGEPNVTQGKSRAPSTGEPGSTYEQVDNKGNVVSRTKYGPNRKPEYRQDYSHEHYSKEEGEYLQPHQHNYTYNAKGQPTGETTTRIK